MHVVNCVRLWESPSPRWADARHGALAGVHTLYSLYIASTWSTRRYTRPAEALHLYSPLQPSTSLHLYISTSSTVYIPLHHPSVESVVVVILLSMSTRLPQDS